MMWVDRVDTGALLSNFKLKLSQVTKRQAVGQDTKRDGGRPESHQSTNRRWLTANLKHQPKAKVNVTKSS